MSLRTGRLQRFAWRSRRAVIAITLLLLSTAALRTKPPVTHRELAFGLAPISPVAAQGAAEVFAIVGQLGGTTEAVAVEGETLYIGQGPRVLILDASGDAASGDDASGASVPVVIG